MKTSFQHEEEVLALEDTVDQIKTNMGSHSIPIVLETQVSDNVVLTARKGRENQRIDKETGLPGSCIGIPFRVGREGTLEILLMKNNKNEWRFPGGTWEKDESKIECVLRECLEEGGLRGEVFDELEPTFHVSRKLNKINKRYFWFIVEIKEYFSRAAENRERKFFPFHNVSEQLSTKEMKDNWELAAQNLTEKGMVPQLEKLPSKQKDLSS